MIVHIQFTAIYDYSMYLYVLCSVCVCVCVFVCVFQFEKFYETKHTGRKLSWLYHMSIGNRLSHDDTCTYYCSRTNSIRPVCVLYVLAVLGEYIAFVASGSDPTDAQIVHHGI